MVSDRAPSHVTALRGALLSLFSKSGKGQTYGEMVYADKDRNTEILKSPALSILGDATPQSFLEGISEELIEHGLLPRILTIEYHGKATYNNPNAHLERPSDQLIAQLVELTVRCQQLNQANVVVVVGLDSDAQAASDRYMRECVDRINEEPRDAVRGLLNRAHLKALKLASLVAVGVNKTTPVVTNEHWLWAERIVTADVENIMSHFEKGNIRPTSSNEQRQYDYMIRCIRELLENPSLALKKTGCQEFADGLVPKMHFQRKTSGIAVFRRSNIGAKRAMEAMLALLVDNGILRVVPENDSRRCGFAGKLYRIEPTALTQI